MLMLIMKQHDQFLFPFYFEWGRDHSCKTRIDRTKEQQNKEKRYICRYIHTHTKKSEMRQSVRMNKSTYKGDRN